MRRRLEDAARAGALAPHALDARADDGAWAASAVVAAVRAEETDEERFEAPFGDDTRALWQLMGGVLGDEASRRHDASSPFPKDPGTEEEESAPSVPSLFHHHDDAPNRHEPLLSLRTPSLCVIATLPFLFWCARPGAVLLDVDDDDNDTMTCAIMP